jgi:hypothetical protein
VLRAAPRAVFFPHRRRGLRCYTTDLRPEQGRQQQQAALAGFYTGADEGASAEAVAAAQRQETLDILVGALRLVVTIDLQVQN